MSRKINSRVSDDFKVELVSAAALLLAYRDAFFRRSDAGAIMMLYMERRESLHC